MYSWGYDLAVGTTLPSIITPAEFATLTQGRMSSTTEQVQAMLDAVSGAVRGYCGWHVTPALPCVWVGDAPDGICHVPAMGVSSVTSVTVDGVELATSAYEWSRSGLVRLRSRAPRWGGVTVEFTAGYEDADDLGGVVAQITANALAASPGVREEHAGQVGITYNQTANGVSGGVRLLDSDRMLLDRWRIRRI